MASSDPVEQEKLVRIVGDPVRKVADLRERIERDRLRNFADIEVAFLDYLWTVDYFRVSEVVPPAPDGIKRSQRALSGEGVYRGKGNIFSELITLLLSNKASQPLASRKDVQGFSQLHQIDIAWPARLGSTILDPLICCEAKLTGAPGVGGREDRAGTADWSNRRKELKFQATDLKLFRQQQSTYIYNWEAWRREAPPLVFTLWAARIVERQEYSKMVQEAQILRDTYLDGVGIFAFEKNEDGSAYVPVRSAEGVPSRVTSLDTVLDVISAKIDTILSAHGGIPSAQVPPKQMPNAAQVSDVV